MNRNLSMAIWRWRTAWIEIKRGFLELVGAATNPAKALPGSPQGSDRATTNAARPLLREKE